MWVEVMVKFIIIKTIIVILECPAGIRILSIWNPLHDSY